MQPVIGAYGKLPSRGDFVRRRLPKSFLDRWDEWLQQAITHSREDLAERWLQLYLNGPMWRFVLASQLIGETTAAGVMMPSIDSVHRHFPLTLAALLAPDVNPFVVALDETWFADLEDLGLACLDADFAPDGLDARLDALTAPPSGMRAGRTSARRGPAGGGEHSGWTIPPDRTAYETLLYPSILDHWLRETSGVYSLWWTSGSDAVEPSFRIFSGLPEPDAFSAFFADEVAPKRDANAPVDDDEDRSEEAVSEDT
jgi:type VI secretion system protein ImpM